MVFFVNDGRFGPLVHSTLFFLFLISIMCFFKLVVFASIKEAICSKRCNFTHSNVVKNYHSQNKPLPVHLND